MRFRKSTILNRTMVLQFKKTLPGCVSSTRLCVSNTAVCNFAGFYASFAIVLRYPYFINAAHSRNMSWMFTKIHVAIWSHFGTIGFNHRVALNAVDVKLDQWSADHDANNRACNRGMHATGPVLCIPGLHFGKHASSNSISRLHQVT